MRFFCRCLWLAAGLSLIQCSPANPSASRGEPKPNRWFSYDQTSSGESEIPIQGRVLDIDRLATRGTDRLAWIAPTSKDILVFDLAPLPVPEALLNSNSEDEPTFCFPAEASSRVDRLGMTLLARIAPLPEWTDVLGVGLGLDGKIFVNTLQTPLDDGEGEEQRVAIFNPQGNMLLEVGARGPSSPGFDVQESLTEMSASTDGSIALVSKRYQETSDAGYGSWAWQVIRLFENGLVQFRWEPSFSEETRSTARKLVDVESVSLIDGGERFVVLVRESDREALQPALAAGEPALAVRVRKLYEFHPELGAPTLLATLGPETIRVAQGETPVDWTLWQFWGLDLENRTYWRYPQDDGSFMVAVLSDRGEVEIVWQIPLCEYGEHRNNYLFLTEGACLSLFSERQSVVGRVYPLRP